MEVYDYYVTPEEYEVAAKNGISRVLVDTRIRNFGWTKKKALTKKIKPKNNYVEWLPLIDRRMISRTAFYKRIQRGWSIYRAITTPIMKRGRIIRPRKYPKEIVELAESNGISYDTFRHRVSRSKWDVMRAATTPLITPKEKGILGSEELRKYINDFYRLRDAQYKEYCYKKSLLRGGLNEGQSCSGEIS